MKNLKTILLVFFCILFAGCEKDQRWDCLKSTGAPVSEERTITGFSKIQLHDNINLVLTQDTVNKVTIKAGKNLLPSITTEVDNETLIIKNENRCNWVRSLKKEVYVYLHVKTLNNLTCYGSGNVAFTNTLVADTFGIELWEATGSINLSLNTIKSFFAQHTGPADITVNGTSAISYIYCAGNGWNYFQQFNARSIYITNTGTGDVFITASDLISAEINGIGNIYYSGNPKEIKASIKSTGKLIKQN